MTTAALTLTITQAGLRRFTEAQLDDDLNLAISSVGLTDALFVIAPTLTALPGEFRRLDAISGKQVGDNLVHMTMRDEADIGYSARGFGLFLPDGTLFAVYGQPDRLFEKSRRAAFLAAIDIVFPTGDVRELRFGNTDFLNPPATSEVAGVVELATEEEATAGTDMRRVAPVGIAARILTALEARLKASVDALATAMGEALDGLAARRVDGSGLVKGGGRNDTNRTLTVDAANGDDVRAATATDKAVTPASLLALSSSFTATGEYSPCPGVLHKVGYVPGPHGEGPVGFKFATPFPNICLIVLPVPINANGSALRDIYMQEQSVSRDGAVAFVQKAGSDGSSIDGFRYLAIGY